MYVLMAYMLALLTECLLTHITDIRVITTMYMLIFKNALMTERYITHVICVRAFTTICTFVLSEHTFA
jgi:hypothetical protein